MGINREEAAQAIENDNGDLNDTVRVAPGPKKGSRPHYHKPDCRHVEPRYQSMTREKAQEELFVPCKECITETADEKSGSLPTELIENVRQKLAGS